MDKEVLGQIESLGDLIPQRKELLQDEVLVCECFSVSAQDIRSVCNLEVDLKLLKDKFGFGEGCTSCLKLKDQWIDKIF
jgi:bacterioferritin-associated ferredoxin